MILAMHNLNLNYYKNMQKLDIQNSASILVCFKFCPLAEALFLLHLLALENLFLHSLSTLDPSSLSHWTENNPKTTPY